MGEDPEHTGDFNRLFADTLQVARAGVADCQHEHVTEVLVDGHDVGVAGFGDHTHVVLGVYTAFTHSGPFSAGLVGNHPVLATDKVFGFSQSESVLAAQEFLGAARVGLCERGGGHGCQGNQDGGEKAFEHGVLLRTFWKELPGY